MKTFEELGVSEQIRHAIEELGFEQPMPVQEEVIPYLLGTRNDVIALAQTGTGKTAAFGIPLLQRVDVRSHQTQAIVLCPTRELCLQIADDLNDFSKYIFNVVLDEADEMLNMGFSEDIDTILAGVPKDRNTLLFSATMSKEIEKIAKNFLNNPKEIIVGSRNEGAEHVNHIYYMVNAKDKYAALKRIVDYNPRIFAIIFCRTKLETQEVADKLIRDGYNAEALHGDLSQQQRDLTMAKFRQHTVQLLVATDVAARGLDVDDLTHVINYGLPNDIESYTHRSGRTGRAGKKGTSISIVHTKEKGKIRAIEKEIQKEFVRGEIPSPQEICKKQLYKVMDQIVKTDVDEEQIGPFMQDISRYFEYIDKDDIIKKIVSMEFGKFLSYYADAPEIEYVEEKKRKEDRGERKGRSSERGPRKPEKGYKRLFINLGKKDGFYPGEAMQFINRHVGGRVPVGHIDLQNTISYFEVPEHEARKVMNALNGAWYKSREVRCNEADSAQRGGDGASATRGTSGGRVRDFRRGKARTASSQEQPPQHKFKKEDWMQFLNPGGMKAKKNDFRGEEPDFSEEGWARRRPKKK